MIHIGPLTCMPEIVAKTILPLVSKEWDIPILTLFLDEHSGEVIQTRLEAFVEMLGARREQREKGEGKPLIPALLINKDPAGPAHSR